MAEHADSCAASCAELRSAQVDGDLYLHAGDVVRLLRHNAGVAAAAGGTYWAGAARGLEHAADALDLGSIERLTELGEPTDAP
jgi:hypothetical protein